MALREDILALATRMSGGSPFGDPDTDVLGAFGMEGDDATEFLERFAETYENSLDGILWYFHFIGDEPPGHRRVLPVGTEGAVIPSYPITLTHLVAAAETGQWPIKYPAHTVRRSLFSKIMIALFCVSVFAVFAAAAFVTIL